MMSETLNLVQVTPVELRQLIEEVVRGQLEKVIELFKPKKYEELLTRRETADLLKITLPTLHNWVNNGLLTAHLIGGRVYFKSSEIERAMIKRN